jgi:hypothetical protein
MPDNTSISLAAEFQSLPLEAIIAAPLKGAIEAQAVAAATTKAFIESMLDKENKPINVQFKISRNIISTAPTTTPSNAPSATTGTTETATIDAPLLSMVPIPHLRIDSLTTHFKYEINLAEKHENELGWSVDATAGTTGLLAKFVSVSLKGTISSKSKEESVMNRSGVLELTLHASEAPIPEGLAKMLNLLSSTIPAPVV